MAKTVEVVIKPGRTYVTGKSAADKNAYGPGDTVVLDEAEAKRLFSLGVAAKKGSEEAQAAKRIADQIPATFPGAKALAEAGIETFSAIADMSEAELVALKGIGEATAKAILEALEAREA